MDHSEGTSVVSKPSGAGRSPRRTAEGSGFLSWYKPEQGKWTRWGSFVAVAALVAWGAVFLDQRLSPFEGDESWRLLITPGISMFLGVGLGVLTWWLCWCHAGAGDFMIATEGEMKKVSWSSRREVIGSTKVVILFTILFAVFLFAVDLVFQTLFSWIGVLKT
jgi:preprotein translocase subunit SecE